MRTGVDRRSSGAWMAICLAVWAAAPAPALDSTLVALDATWRYRDAGQAPAAGWREPDFDDSGWASGAAELGYGDGDEATVVSFGADANAKPITTYFRRAFTVADAGAWRRLTTRLRRDDGAVVYLNGTELRRDLLPAGMIDATTLASAVVGGAAESALVAATHDVAALRAGENVVAVEVHQSSATSSDISFALELVASTTAAGVVRGPYLQAGTPTGIVVRWRTDQPTPSRVWYGASPAALAQSAGSDAPAVEHVVPLAGLTPDSEYFYAVGDGTEVLAGGDAAHGFRTLPPAGAATPIRLWVLGDSGTGGAGARAVRDAWLDFAAGAPPTAWLMLGDNAYPDGTDAELQRGLFDVYQPLLTTAALWPTFGNHDGHSADSATQSGPYYDVFSLPAAGQAGGVASGTEAYYAVDIGNVHLLSLDSYESSRAPGGAMLSWAAADLAASDADWVIAFWHHPPYSKGSHDSDHERAMMEMRADVLPVLEAGGVDLVLTGHSHAYERSPLLDGHYGDSTTFTAAMLRDAGDGRVEGDGPYAKPLGRTARGGTVYVVAGNGAEVRGGGALDHPALPVAFAVLGSLVVDVAGPTLSVRLLSDRGEVHDAFTITKGAVAAQEAAGAVTYYRGARAVAGVALTAGTSSDAAGAFAVAAPRGAPVALRPRHAADTGAAVTSLDAAWVLQRVAGRRALDATQTAACDVTGDGTVSALDAAMILQHAIGSLARLPAAVLCDSDFLFAPAAVVPFDGRAIPFGVADGTCRPGALELEPMYADAAGLDFHAAAFGDCTGNWSP